VDFGGGRAPADIQDVHHLALAPAQVAVSVFAHAVCCKSSMLQK
jgi:hypothetical protein